MNQLSAAGCSGTSGGLSPPTTAAGRPGAAATRTAAATAAAAGIGRPLSDARPRRAGVIRPVEAALGRERVDHRVDARRLDAAVDAAMLMRPMSPFGRPLASFVHVLPAFVDL